MSIRSTDPSWLSWFFNHWPEILLTDFLRYAIPAGMLAVILVLCADRLAKRRIQSTPRSTTDLIRELTHSASTVLIFSMVGLAIAASEQMGWMRILFGSDQVLWQAANLVVMILLHDAYFYWSHRAMHHKRLFKWVHRTHHLSRQPGPFTAYSFAPLEAVVEALFLPLYLLVVPTHAIVIALFLVHMVLRNVIAHAGVELFPAKWMAWPILRHFTVTSHHDMHHAHFNCNYGFYFTWWDRWMGTEHPEYVSRFEHLTQAGTQPVRKGRETQVGKVGLLAVIAGATLLSADLDAQTQQKTAAPAPCPVDGLWVTEGFDAIVEVTSADELSGTVTWVYDEDRHSLVGEQLFSNFQQSGCTWTGGLIFNPANRKRYRSSITWDKSGYLSIKGCLGPFCQSQTWRPYRQVFKQLPLPPADDSDGLTEEPRDPARQIQFH